MPVLVVSPASRSSTFGPRTLISGLYRSFDLAPVCFDDINPLQPYGTATNLVAVPFGAKVLRYTWPDRTWVLEQLVVVEPPRFRFTIKVPFVVLNRSPGSHVILFLYSREFVVINKLLSGSLTALAIGPRNLHEPSLVTVRV